MVIIKRYPNRKLYNTEEKQYITLEGIADLIRQGEEVRVVDHTTGEDLTTLTLTQIILEQEKKQSGLLSNSLLTSLIRAGGDRLTAIQRGILSSINFWHQIDEEIKRRVQMLVRQGELTALDGEKLIKKLLDQSLRQIRSDPAGKELDQMSAQELEAYLKQRQIPSQDDLQRLYDQIEELDAKLKEVAETRL